MLPPILRPPSCNVVALLACVLAAAPIAARGAPSLSYLPAEVQTATKLAPLDGNEVLHFHALLPSRQPELQRRLVLASQDSKVVASPLSQARYHALFHPLDAEVTRAVAAFTARSFALDGEPQGLFVPLRASAAALQEAFGVAFLRYRSVDGRVFVAPDGEPTVPSDLPVDSFHGLVQGLQRLVVPPRTPRATTGLRGQALLTPTVGPSTPPLVNGTTLRRAYNVPATARGQGQTVALIASCTVYPSDLALYARTNGLPLPKLNYVALPGTSCAGDDFRGEYSLDVEMISTMAPDLDELRIYLIGDYLTSLNEIANPTLGDAKLMTTLSASITVGASSAQDRANWEKVLAQMAAQGQTLFVSSGDDGAFGPSTDPALPPCSPSACAVGGTVLSADATGAFVKEQGWTGSGGGTNTGAALPAYQRPLTAAATALSSMARNVPDVALTAENVQMAFQGQLYGVGGTSVAAPLWAGVFALLQEARVGAALPPIGFFNPVLYALGAAGGTPYATAFRDVRSGSNGAFAATPGYDLVTGWGSPNVAGLLAVLSGPPAGPAVVQVPFVVPAVLRRGGP